MVKRKSSQSVRDAERSTKLFMIDELQIRCQDCLQLTLLAVYDQDEEVYRCPTCDEKSVGVGSQSWVPECNSICEEKNTTNTK